MAPVAPARSGGGPSTRRGSPAGSRLRLGADVDELDIKDQAGIGRDRANSVGPVSELRRNEQAAVAADLHRRDPLVESVDNLAGPQGEQERLVAVEGAVELLAGGGDIARVMDN